MLIRNKILLGGLFVFTLSITSCENSKFLNEPPLSFTSPENFYKNEKDLKIALVGCYDAINTSSVPGASVGDGTYSRGLLFILGAGNDELLPNTSSELADFGRLSYLSSNSCLSQLWAAYYAGISRCNLLIEKAEAVNMDQLQKKQIIGEARFLRAFYYNHLATVFGGVPLSTNSEPNSTAPRKELKEVYELIIDDLNYAYTNLDQNSIYNGGANKWTAGGYLGTIYNYLASCKRYHVGQTLNFQLNDFSWVDELTMSKNAEDVLKDVVENSGYALVENAKYSHLFRESTKTEQYKECLFLAEASNTITDEYPEISNFPIPAGDRNIYGGGYGRLRPTRELYLSYHAGDIRRDHNITGSYTTASTKESVGGKNYYVPVAPVTGSKINWCTGKFRCIDPKEKAILPSATQLNYPLLRFADILLHYAEALYFNGNETKARSYLNEIRNRVLKTGTNVTTLNTAYYKADFIEELLDERKRELCFETKRRIDLIRFNKLKEAIFSINLKAGNHNEFAADMQNNYEYFKIWMPLPETQLALNRSLIQNPGY
ncbi:RagB/SusD family nutrient uptake outer membrane protein [Pedobacter sp. ASV1-7]|uniref:RagB/SusD family nutrient uptake outer membrane protein n=1 Tax=Pedobacter sp. ASV1-7 TaxID=3145237 RepID=UPI0032E8DD1B